mmetsp:Transcript_4396/g.6472  ORF Transcript_4396/g.6472 Transcript_4396/m.6472 type:complete len:387 (+) Transcript_4396:43-1203(+)
MTFLRSFFIILIILFILTNFGIAEDIASKSLSSDASYSVSSSGSKDTSCITKNVKVLSKSYHSLDILQNLAAFLELKYDKSIHEFHVLDRITSSRFTTYSLYLPSLSSNCSVQLRDGKMSSFDVSLPLGSFSEFRISSFHLDSLSPFSFRDAPISVNSTEGLSILMDIASRYPSHFLRYLTLSNSYATQYLTTVCGLSSLANVFNALNVRPMSQIPRLSPYSFWTFDSLFNNSNLPAPVNCLRQAGLSFSSVSRIGLTLEQEYTIAKCYFDHSPGFSVSGEFGSEIPSLDSFRDNWVLKSMSSSSPSYLILNYARHAVQQAGGGHFSPLGLYSPERDLVLVMDTARFKYPPVFLPLSTVYESMLEKDPGSNRSRGILLLSSIQQQS